MAKLTFLVAVLLIAMYARAATPGAMLRATPLVPPVEAPNGPIYSHNGTRLPPLNTTYTFNQLKDHNNSGLGTFAQRYWINWQFYSPGADLIHFPLMWSTPCVSHHNDARWTDHSFHTWTGKCRKSVWEP